MGRLIEQVVLSAAPRPAPLAPLVDLGGTVGSTASSSPAYDHGHGDVAA